VNPARTVTPNLLRQSAIALLIGGSFGAPALLAAQRAPDVDVWFERGNEFDRGEPGRVMYSADAGSYTSILRVNTDGLVTVLSPSQPNGRSKYTGGRDGIGIPFQADPTEGVGYVFAVASSTPFDFRNYRGSGNRWNTGALGRRGGVDPFEIIDRFARSSVGRRGSYSIAYAPYEIGRSGVGRAAYPHGVRFDEGYGGYYGGYDDPWGASPYRRGYDGFQYQGGYGHSGGYAPWSGRDRGRGYTDSYGYDSRNSRYSQDPRTRSLRHCPDGTLAPYTTPCRSFTRPNRSATKRGRQPPALTPPRTPPRVPMPPHGQRPTRPPTP
jgi:hypothetical protein